MWKGTTEPPLPYILNNVMLCVVPPSQQPRAPLRRLSQKTTPQSPKTPKPAQPTKAAQESLDMPPPVVPAPFEFEHVSHEIQEQKDERPSSPTTPVSSGATRRRWETFTDSEEEKAPNSVDLQSHDPRPESVVIAGWGQGLAPAASVADTEQHPVLRRPLLLTAQEKITEVGQLIDSSLPFNYDVNQTHESQPFKTPRDQLPAWKDREEFIKKPDGSRLLIVKAPTGSGKTTVFPALATRALPKRFGRICCTQVRRATTQGVCTGTKKMWSIHENNKVVGFQHGLEKSSQWNADDTRIVFLTEGIIMRQSMRTLDINSPYSVIDGCAVLVLDEVHSGSSDMELILARVLPKLKNVTNFKVVLLSATLNVEEFMQRAREAGLQDKYIAKMESTGRHQQLINRCLPPGTPRVRDNIELAARAVITLHQKYATGYPD